MPDKSWNPLEGYRSENVKLSNASDMTPGEAEDLIGRTIVAVYGDAHALALALDDGSLLRIAGHTYSSCALDVTVDPPDAKGPTP